MSFSPQNRLSRSLSSVWFKLDLLDKLVLLARGFKMISEVLLAFTFVDKY